MRSCPFLDIRLAAERTAVVSIRLAAERTAVVSIRLAAERGLMSAGTGKRMGKRDGLSFYKRKKKIITAKLAKEIASWIAGIAAAVFIAAVLDYFFGMSTYVVGASMEPTLYSGQRIFINRLSYTVSKPKAGDVAVFFPNGNRNAHYYVKRVAAVPGDTVLIQDGKLYVNGEASSLISAKIAEAGIAESEFTLGKEEYFCIGDNPAFSEDSRSADIGPVSAEDIIGKAWLAFSAGNQGETGLIK